MTLIPSENRVRIRLFEVFMWLLLVSILNPARAMAQYLNQLGAPTWTTAEPVELGYINVANGNLHLQLPVTAPAQRGKVGYSAQLVYDSRIWAHYGVWHPTPGWRLMQTAAGTANHWTSANTCSYTCGPGGKQCQSTWYSYGGYWYTDSQGTQRTFPIYSETANICHTPVTPSTSGNAVDGSGYSMYTQSHEITEVLAPDGTRVYPQLKDTNGNCLSTSSDTGTCSAPVAGQPVHDTLDRTPLTSSVNGNTTTYTILTAQGQQSVIVTYTTVYVHTLFGQSGQTEYQGHFNEISSVQYPDSNVSYQFSYDTGTSDTDPTYHFGELTGITLPSGATVKFLYFNFADATGDHNEWATRRSTDNGTTWTFYTPSTCGGSCQKVIVTRPSGDQTIYTFTLQSGGDWNSSVAYYTGTSTLLKTISNTYQSYTAHGDFGSGTAFQTLASTTTTVPGQGVNLVSKTTYTYDTYTYSYRGNNYTGTLGRVLNRSEYGFGSGSNGPLARQTVSTYYGNTNLISDVQIKTGSGSKVAETSIAYDDYTAPSNLTGVTNVSHHDDNGYGSGFTGRFNPTKISRWVAGSTSLTSALAYDTTGQITASIDAAGHSTGFDYDSTSSLCATSYSHAYVKKITNALSQATLFCYDFNTGLLTDSQDPNNATTHFDFDNMNRPTGTTFPTGGGSATTTYTSATLVDSYRTLTGSVTLHSQTSSDNLGRPIRTKLVSEPGGGINVDTSYDTSGRVQTVSNPYRSTGDPTYGVSTPSYDGLGRVTSVLNPDQTSTSSSYGSGTQSCSSVTYGLGFPVLGTDEAGNQRRIFTDALGRVIEVDEPDPTNGNSLTLSTCYSYNVLDELTGVSQGSLSRSYSYDGLGRVTSATTPESGTTNYTYDSDATCTPSSNGDLVKRLDARNVRTCYAYEALHRLTSKTYSDTTPTVSFSYDLTSCPGLTLSIGNPVGRRTCMSDGSGQTAWSYDPMGRVLTEQQKIGTATKAITYSYNNDGSLASVTYPSGRTVSYDVQGDGRPTYAKDTANSINYALSTTYAPQGAVDTTINGQVNGGFNGITLAADYNSRLWPTSTSATSSNGTALSLGFTYYGNGNLQRETLSNQSRSGTIGYTYDSLNRVATAKSPYDTGATWQQTFAYDRYGNLNQITGNNSVCFSVNAANQIYKTCNEGSTTISYDLSGDLTNNHGTTYAWDGEFHVKSAGGVTYMYDGNGNRVQKSTGTLYWYGAGGMILAETDTSGNALNEYVYFGGARIARRDGSGNVFYYYGDRIGSARTMTNATGTICYDTDFYPFGDQRPPSSSTCAQNFKFAGMERDAETNFDHTMFRQYYSSWGRWLSPDPLAGAVSNPQSLNRYAYVLNNPTNLFDPFGLQCVPGTQNCDTPPTCHDYNCASQYYGGSKFPGFGEPGTGSLACVTDGIESYNCNELFNNLHGSMMVLNEAAAAQAAAFSNAKRYLWVQDAQVSSRLIDIDDLLPVAGGSTDYPGHWVLEGPGPVNYDQVTLSYNPFGWGLAGFSVTFTYDKRGKYHVTPSVNVGKSTPFLGFGVSWTEGWMNNPNQNMEDFLSGWGCSYGAQAAWLGETHEFSAGGQGTSTTVIATPQVGISCGYTF